MEDSWEAAGFFKDNTKRPVAMITGGTRGIGAGIAEQLCQNYDLILGFRANVDAAEKFRAQLLETYVETKVVLIHGSILDDFTVTKYFETVDGTFGGHLNVLVHNAVSSSIPEGDLRNPEGIPEAWMPGSLLTKGASSKEIIDFTLLDNATDMAGKCLINFAERAISRMEDDNGSIIFISSPGCNNTEPVRPGFGLRGFGRSSGEFAIRCYAKSLQSRGINANTIIPGVVNTDIWTRKLKHLGPRTGLKTRDEVLEHVRKQTGQRRVLDPSELGKVVRFICMTPCITGMSINVDYGIHLGR